MAKRKASSWLRANDARSGIGWFYATHAAAWLRRRAHGGRAHWVVLALSGVVLVAMVLGAWAQQPTAGGSTGGAGQGSRFRVEIPGLPDADIYQSDAAAFFARSQVEADLAAPPVSLGINLPRVRPLTTAAPPVDVVGFCALPFTPPMWSVEETGDSLVTASSDPTQDFRQRLESVYFVTNDDEVRVLWRYYVAEPDTVSGDAIGIAEKTGNAVVKYNLALSASNPPRSLSDAQVSRLKQIATHDSAFQVQVNSASGVSARRTPWGLTVDAIANGTVLTVDPPPDDGGWVRVEGVGQEEWVNGLWLDSI